jgi:hypothetical protein
MTEATHWEIGVAILCLELAYPDAFDFSPNSQSGLDSLAVRSAVRLAVVSPR